MNYTQIADLYRQDEWGKCLSNKIGTTFELLEEYIYDTDIGVFLTLPKGMKIIFKGPVLNGWIFRPSSPKDMADYGPIINFGRSRLLKLKLKELQSARAVSRFKQYES